MRAVGKSSGLRISVGAGSAPVERDVAPLICNVSSADEDEALTVASLVPSCRQ
jgi:hypothetical protein